MIRPRRIWIGVSGPDGPLAGPRFCAFCVQYSLKPVLIVIIVVVTPSRGNMEELVDSDFHSGDGDGGDDHDG